MPAELIPAPAGTKMTVDLVTNIDDGSQYFPDRRDGTDRWGTPNRTKTACGTGWGAGQYVCPLYVAEVCPGEKQRGTREAPPGKYFCNLECGRCGGGGRAETFNVCGQAKGALPLEWAIAEFDGSLRIDQQTAPAGRVIAGWPAAFAPSVEWGGGQWLRKLRDGNYPIVLTTVRTCKAPARWPARTPLRARLGGFDGFLGVHGLVPDNHLDDAWDRLDDTIRFAKDGGVDLMISPQYSYYCVPLDSEILTRRGWKHHDELVAADETLGLDPATGETRWTPITGVHRFDSAPTVVVNNRKWQARCTPQHRWLLADETFAETTQLRHHDGHLLLSAPYEGGVSPLTPQEAALIAWLYTDGSRRYGRGMPDADRTHLRRRAAKTLVDSGFNQTQIASLFGITHEAVRHLCSTEDAHRGLDLRITQSKAIGVEHLTRLLADVPHTLTEKTPGEWAWYIHADYAHPLWQKAGLWDDPDLSRLVLSLSRLALEAFMEAAWIAEGWYGSNSKLKILAQKHGPTCEALKLGAFLLGHRPSDRQANADPEMRTVTECAPRLGRPSLRVEAAADTAVWCPTTELGTWTMRQPTPPTDAEREAGVTPSTICLTGNSTDPLAMWAYNSCRSMRYYAKCLEAGVPYVALDVPAWGVKWWFDDYLTFITNNDVKIICIAYQLISRMMGAEGIHAAKLLHSTLPPDVSIICIGASRVSLVLQLSRLFKGRNLLFSNSEVAARAAFFALMGGQRAPLGWDKADAFSYNVELAAWEVDAAMGVKRPAPKARKVTGEELRDARARLQERKVRMGTPEAKAKRRETKRRKMLKKRGGGR